MPPRRECRPAQKRDGLRTGARAARRPLWTRRSSPIWSPIVSTGLRLDIGSWKMMAISCPRMRAIRSSSRRARSTTCAVASSGTGSRRHRHARRCGRDRRMIDRPVTDLPEPGLADDRQHLALADAEAHAVDRLARAASAWKLVFRPRLDDRVTRATARLQRTHSARRPSNRSRCRARRVRHVDHAVAGDDRGLQDDFAQRILAHIVLDQRGLRDVVGVRIAASAAT